MSIEVMKQLMLKSPYPWWQWDVDTNNVIFSPLKASMIGYDPSYFVNQGYQAFTALVHPEDYDKTMVAMRKVLYERADLYQVDYRIKDRFGEYHWYVDRGVVIERNGDGKPRIVRGIVIDLGREGLFSGSQEFSCLVIQKSLLTLSNDTKSFLTICAGCKKVKVMSGTYVEITSDLLSLLSEETSHGICPDCMNRLYPEIAELHRRKAESRRTSSST